MNLCLKCGRLYEAEIARCPQDGEELLPYEATVHDGEEVAGVVLGRVLGVGPCGKIVDGIETASGERVVVRLLGAEMIRDRPAADGLRRHLLQAKAFVHPGVVRIRSVTAQDDRVVVIRDDVGGERLEDLLSRETALPAERAVRIAIQVCTILAAAHRAGLLHLQIRASNVFLVPGDTDDEVRLIDFGIGPLQRIGARCVYGMPYSLAPEQIDLKLQPSAKSDILAVGLLLFHMLTGKTAFSRTGDPTQVLSQPLPLLRAPDGSALPPALETLVRQMADRKPPLRPTNMDVVVDRLGRLLPEGQTRVSKPPPAQPAPAKPAPVVRPPAPRPAPSAHLADDEPEEFATIVMSEHDMASAIAAGTTLPTQKSQKPAAPQPKNSAPARPAASPPAGDRASVQRPAAVQAKVSTAKSGHSTQWRIGVGAAAGAVVLGLLALLVPLLASGPKSESARDAARMAAPADMAEAGVVALDVTAEAPAEPRDVGLEAVVREAGVDVVEVPQPPVEPDAAVAGGDDVSADGTEQVGSVENAAVKERILALVQLGNRALAARRLDTAREAYENALALDSQDRAARLGMGRTAFQQGLFEEAVTYLEPIFRHRGSMDLGLAYMRVNRIDDARQQFALVLARDPSNADAARALQDVLGQPAPGSFADALLDAPGDHDPPLAPPSSNANFLSRNNATQASAALVS
jgi:serine/threonine-protein kinase